MTRKQYKITRCKDCQCSQHDVQCNVTNVNNNSPQFIVGSAKKCSGHCTSFFVLEKRRAISPSPTEIVYWSRVTLCNIYYFIPRFSGVGIFCLPLSARPGVCFRGIGRELVNRISWKLVIMSPTIGDGDIQFHCPFVKKWFPWNSIKTPQHNHFKIICLEMLLRTSHTDQVRISLCGVFCINRFLLWLQTYIVCPYISQAGHSFHSYFCHIILVIKAVLLWMRWFSSVKSMRWPENWFSADSCGSCIAIE